MLAALHGGWSEPAPWGGFLRLFQERCGADLACLLIQRPSGDGLDRWPAGDAGATFDANRLQQLRSQRVYAAEEIEGAVSGAQFARIVRVSGGASSAWFAVARSGGDFAAADSALLSAFAPHISIAVRNYVELKRSRAEAAIADDLLARAGIAWRLDEQTRSRNWAEDKRDVLQLQAPNGCANTLAVTRLPIEPRTQQPRALAELWSFTPSEARFAMTMAEGKSLSEAADALDLTLETARHYSKRLYAKTGARGLPDLVRLVLNSVAMLA